MSFITDENLRNDTVSHCTYAPCSETLDFQRAPKEPTGHILFSRCLCRPHTKQEELYRNLRRKDHLEANSVHTTEVPQEINFTIFSYSSSKHALLLPSKDLHYMHVMEEDKLAERSLQSPWSVSRKFLCYEKSILVNPSKGTHIKSSRFCKSQKCFMCPLGMSWFRGLQFWLVTCQCQTVGVRLAGGGCYIPIHHHSYAFFGMM